ncbi:hypothetical protein BC937DRAFT_93902 [Endogone sp. FLAS-F59071]|nr:hypothetical protein BC937DRAFT_93902 [Endogone sp. FLAS-F59071]|eukprot:RUS14389.1 hypothetical protein BC937DRAFT_93902 [Endogone sp. FLAS-F59071]
MSAYSIYPRRTKWIIVAIGFFTSALIILYWVLWFVARDVVATFNTEAYYEFEQAFVLADSYLGLVALIGVIGLCFDKRWAVFFTFTAGSAGLYVGCMDFLYDMQHGVWDFADSQNAGGAAIELCIVVYTLCASGYVLAWSWWVIDRELTQKNSVEAQRL